METKSLLIGISSFIAGGLLVSIAATTFEKNDIQSSGNSSMSASMQDSTNSLKNKTGDEFDKAFITEMIAHHKGAIDMAKVAQTNGKHDEIKTLAEVIISAQEKEITDMKQWQMNWGYENSMSHFKHSSH